MKKMHAAALALLAAFVCLSSCKSGAIDEAVTIQGDHGRLVGRVLKAESAGKCPLTIVCHGLTGNHNEDHLMAVVDSLYSAGIATVRFDFNGHGQSEGRFSQMTLDNELADLHCIYDYVCSLPWVDKRNISIVGHSQGGLISGLFAGDMGADAISTAVLLAPAACITVQAQKGNMFSLSTPLSEMPDSLEFWGGRYLGKAYVEGAAKIDCYARTAAYSGPILIVQGDKDDPGLLHDARNYAPAVKQLEYVEIEGLTHCFPEDYATPAKYTKEFIVKNLR